MTEQACGNKQKNQLALTIRVMWAKMIRVLPSIPNCRFPNRGPVAQLGARFHGMEEVVGSIPTRSTKFNPPSRSNFYLDSVRYSLPNLIDFLIGDGDAPVSPVPEAVGGADRTEAVGQCVDKDIASRRNAFLEGNRAVVLVGIRDVDRLVKPAVAIAEI
jgi:hypothetical protein